MLRPDVDRVFELIKEENFQPFFDKGNKEYRALEQLCRNLVPQKTIQVVGPDNVVENKMVPDFQGLDYMDLIELLKKAKKL